MIKLFLSTTFFLGCIFIPVLTRAADLYEDHAREIYSTVMSPFCPARLLSDCPSPSATELKVKILSDLRGGKSKERVLEELYSTFGSSVRAAPEAKGFGALAWWIPILFVVVGSIIFGIWLAKRKTSDVPASGEEANQLSPEMQSRIQEELNKSE